MFVLGFIDVVSGGPGCPTESDIVFMLDSSGSVTQTHFEKLLSFVAYLSRIIGLQDGKTRVGLLIFNDDAKIYINLADHQTSHSLSNAIMAVQYQPGKTNMAAGIRRMRDEMFQRDKGDRPGVPNIAVLIADGYSTKDSEYTTNEAIKARNRGIQFFTISIGLEDTDELELITNNKDRVFITAGFDFLIQIALQLKEAICKGTCFIHNIANIMNVRGL